MGRLKAFNMNKERIVLFLLFISIVGALFTSPMPGLDKLSISNVVHLLVTVILMIVNPRFTGALVKLVCFVVVMSLISHMYVAIKYGYSGKALITLHIVTGIVFIFLMSDAINQFSSEQNIKKTLMLSVLVAIGVLIVSAVSDFRSGLPSTNFTFDDKSHATIYICFLSFLSLRYFDRSRYIVAFALIVLCFFSVSRLVVLFIPFLGLMALLQISRKQSFLSKVVLSVTLFLSSIASTSYIYQNSEKIQLLERISTRSAVLSSESTQAHFLLLKHAVELKFDSFSMFLFGASPGSFADILIRSERNFSDLAAVDPAFIYHAYNSTAPIHSTHAAVLVEYPLPVFILYIIILFSTVKSVVKQKKFELLYFGVPFFASTMFYSAHNKFYFFVILVFIVVLIDKKTSIHRYRRLPIRNLRSKTALLTRLKSLIK